MTDERALVRQIQNGDPSAFADLVEQYKKKVYYLALDLHGNHHDAEDLSQEVFMKAYRGIRGFRGDSKIGSWLYRITVNTYLGSKKKKADQIVMLVDKKSDNDIDPLEARDEVTGNPERAVVSRRINEHVTAALQQLSQQERTVFVMRHYHDMPLKEISDTLNVAEGTVKSLLFRSIRKLRQRLSFYKEELGLEDPAK
ncbi:MAG: RNA polymerase sigma factor [Candidatus Latescibacterota bacterium]|nr:MAG: RNA polymerase sigma factor [Candidatus Latescibacterota bacterium]